MSLSQKEIWQRFESLQQKMGIAGIIESKSLLNMIKVADNERLPLAHEKILFATIAGNSDFIAPEMKLISMLDHYKLISSKEQDKRKNSSKK